ncbi:MAG: hypothetical protein QOJ64_2765 [Acidobacteriota bacterium]|jgi:hypothetical protein|nr:hypothetical protein [Acidobacteriota bacterium]
MKNRGLFLSFLSVVAALSLPVGQAAYAHKFHVSFAEVDYNREEQSLQISLRTFPDDVENILSRRAGRRISLDRRKEVEPLLFAYLQETFRLENAEAGSVKLSWVGMESKVDSVWIYFEAKLGIVKGLILRDRFLQDLFRDQVNKVSITGAGKKASMTFSPGDDFKPIPVVF